jgi:glycosyltransferase involved in cell wall biosynthesis
MSGEENGWTTSVMVPSVPAVTILLPVLNGEKWIEMSVNSLQNQSFQDFEILIIDDGCTDSTLDIVRNMRLPSIRVIRGQGHGVGAALALGVLSTSSPLIARQDADDISHARRLEKQVHYMGTHPQCVMTGTWAQKIDEDDKSLGLMKVPRNSKSIKLRLNFSSPFIHPSVMLRRDAVLKVGNYRAHPGNIFAEDYDLWTRMALIGEIHNIGEPLISYRINPSGVTGIHGAALSRSGTEIALHNTEVTLGESFDVRDKELFYLYFGDNKQITVKEAFRIYKLLFRLQSRSGFPPPLAGISPRSWLAPIARTVRASHRPALLEGTLEGENEVRF